MSLLLTDSLAGLDRDPARRRWLFQRPIHRFALGLTAGRLHLAAPPPPDWTLGFPGFLKLGAKSWRDGGRLEIVAADAPFAAAAARLLDAPTPTQRRYLHIVRSSALAIDLWVYRYRDFTDIGEVRWIADGDRVRRSSACLRGRSRDHAHTAEPAMRALIERLRPFVPARIAIDLAILPDGGVRLLELNPL